MLFIIKNIFNNTKELIKNDFVCFLNLIAINSLLIFFIALSSQWIEENMNIFEFQLAPITLRITLFLFFEGLMIGYLKLILNFINQRTFHLKEIISNFHIIPKYIILQLFYYLTMLPSAGFILYKFPYSIEKYGTNFNEYLFEITTNISNAMSNEITWQLSFAFFNTYDIFILCFLSILPVIYILYFWCAQILIIDKNYSIYKSLIISYQIAKPRITLSIILLLVGLAIISMLLGMLFFIFSFIGLTLIYIIMLQYYKYLLHRN